MAKALNRISLVLLAALFIAAGAAHFAYTEEFATIIPRAWNDHAVFMVYVTGALEILGGVGLLLPGLRRAAGIGLALLLCVMVIANIYMAVEGITLPGWNFPRWVYQVRPYLQPLLILWVLYASGWIGKAPRR